MKTSWRTQAGSQLSISLGSRRLRGIRTDKMSDSVVCIDKLVPRPRERMQIGHTITYLVEHRVKPMALPEFSC